MPAKFYLDILGQSHYRESTYEEALESARSSASKLNCDVWVVQVIAIIRSTGQTTTETLE